MTINNAMQKFINDHSGRAIVVAYSGGVDSHVVLNAMSQVQDQFDSLSVIHINHSLSVNADAWASHCQAVCDELSIAFKTVKVTVECGSRDSLESQARKARYEALIEHTAEHSVVVLGQHQDDQLETFLLQLKRGAGPTGLSSMGYQRCINERVFVRPLLDVSQQDILSYAQQHQLNWIEDESNSVTSFDRNFLRHDIIPKLVQRWPSVAKTVARSASLCAEQQALLDEVTKNYFNHCRCHTNGINVEKLTGYSLQWQTQLLRYWLKESGHSLPSATQLQQLLMKLNSSHRDNTILYESKRVVVRQYQGSLLLTMAVEKRELTIDWKGQSELPWCGQHRISLRSVSSVGNEGLTLNVDPIIDTLTITNHSFNTPFRPKGERFSKPLKQWFKLWKIPPWERDEIPQIWKNGELVALLGICLSDAVKQRQNGNQSNLLQLLLV